MRFLVLLLLLTSPEAWSQMYRCSTSDGPVYQDRPCANGSSTGTYNPPAISTQSGKRIDGASIRRERPISCSDIPNAEALRTALQIGQQCTDRCRYLPNKNIVIGLSRGELETLCGAPEKTNSSGRGGTVSSQYVYRGAGPAYYFYFDGDRLTSWSD